MARTRATNEGAAKDREHFAGDDDASDVMADGPTADATILASADAVAAVAAASAAETLAAATAAAAAAAAAAGADAAIAASIEAPSATPSVSVAVGSEPMLPMYMTPDMAAYTNSTRAATAPPRAPGAMALMAPSPVSASNGATQRFPPFRESYADMGELRRELKVLSVQMSLPYFMHHSSPQRLEARCPTWKNRKHNPVTCDFVVAANRHTNGRVYITRANLTHSLTR
ncbi:hypothetical protein P43SY_000093 [Pythium insidiosum]|uniref:Uncharacterized protein n=1 Tax=Pythium insidiosum TaxID=114742 RepID=A0AAD5Q296_PYTIN|nr:hypothetical protein P43SY_000093 [Pythium insidiosum]